MSNISNVGKPWTENEVKELIQEVGTPNLTLPAIAQKHGRTTKGVVERLKLVAFTMTTNQAMNVEEVVMKLRFLSKDDVLEVVQKKKGKSLLSSSSVDQDKFKILWDFKLFMKERFDFDEETHNLFDEFVKTYKA
jgi:hypothetical protein